MHLKRKITNDLFRVLSEDDAFFEVVDEKLNTDAIFSVSKEDENYEVCEDVDLILRHVKDIKKSSFEKIVLRYINSSPNVQINNHHPISLVSMVAAIENSEEVSKVDDHPYSRYISDNKWLVFINIPTSQIVSSKKYLYKARKESLNKMHQVKNDIENSASLAELDSIDTSVGVVDNDLIVDGVLMISIDAPELMIVKNTSNGGYIQSQVELDEWLAKQAS